MPIYQKLQRRQISRELDYIIDKFVGSVFVMNGLLFAEGNWARHRHKTMIVIAWKKGMSSQGYELAINRKAGEYAREKFLLKSCDDLFWCLVSPSFIQQQMIHSETP